MMSSVGWFRDSPGVLSEQPDNASRLAGAWQPRSASLARASHGSALAARFEQADPGRDGNIERGNRPYQRDGDDPVAELARQPAQPRSFGAQHPGKRPRQVGVEQIFGAAGFGAGQPYAAILEFAQRPGEIRDSDDRYGIRRAGSGL